MSERSDFADLLEPGFREIFDDAFLELPLVFPRIFNVDSSKKQDEKTSGVTGFGLFEETDENESIRYEDPVQLFDTIFIHLKYTKGFKISEELWEDELYGAMRTKPGQLGRAARRTAENSAAGVFNNAFVTANAGGDGKPLCSTVHPRSDLGSSQSNASATGVTLTEENFETGRTAARQQLDDKGMRIQVMPNMVLVPVDLEKDAKIITGSTMRSGTADNDMNIYKDNFEVIAWEYLTTNNTMWYLLDKRQQATQWYWRIRPEFKKDNAFNTGQALFKGRMRFSNGWTDWRGVWGSLGDGQAYAS